MRYKLLKDVVDLLGQFEDEASAAGAQADIEDFKLWLAKSAHKSDAKIIEPDWEGKSEGRSVESVISTLFVHLNRYAKMYSKAAMQGSLFSTQEEFIYLINLRAFGPMAKMELIKRNIQEKPVGMQIIHRLLNQGWVEQRNSELDKRSKIIAITEKGLGALEIQMPKIRQATQIVTGRLVYEEKLELIRLLTKLDHFHKPIFASNVLPANLLDMVSEEYLTINN